MDARKRFCLVVALIALLTSTGYNLNVEAGGTKLSGITGASAIAAAAWMVSRCLNHPQASDPRYLLGDSVSKSQLPPFFAHLRETMAPSDMPLISQFSGLNISDETRRQLQTSWQIRYLFSCQNRPLTIEERLRNIVSQKELTLSGWQSTDQAILADRLLDLQSDAWHQRRVMEQNSLKLGLAYDKMRELVEALRDETIELQEHANVVTTSIDQISETIEELALQISIEQAKTTDGQFTWRIPGVAQRIKQAQEGEITSVFSAPFYTDPRGYQLALRAYLNGDGTGEGVYLSLFIVLMKGTHDPLLRWPFKRKVMFILHDQSPEYEGRNDFRLGVITNDGKSFQKPVEKMNIASGLPKFIPLSHLTPHSSSDQPDGKPWYVVDDTLFVSAEVKDIIEMSRKGDDGMDEDE